jgi:hypothetical protein
MRKTLLIAVFGGLLAASPAPASTIQVGHAAEAVRTAAQALGEVDGAECWRPILGARRARRTAVCVAWWVHSASGASCAVFYEVRMDRRRLKVSQTFEPWCDSVPVSSEA